MKLIPLSKKGKHAGKYSAIVDDSDYEWLMQWNWSVSILGKKIYAVRYSYETGKKINILMHRQILNLIDPKADGDHKNNNGLDNQRHNLRKSTRSQNIANRTKIKNGSSKYLGVTRKTQNGHSYWYAQLEKSGVAYCLGTHKTEEDAAMAYDKKAKEIHGEFANLNFR